MTGKQLLVEASVVQSAVPSRSIIPHAAQPKGVALREEVISDLGQGTSQASPVGLSPSVTETCSISPQPTLQTWPETPEHRFRGNPGSGPASLLPTEECSVLQGGLCSFKAEWQMGASLLDLSCERHQELSNLVFGNRLANTSVSPGSPYPSSCTECRLLAAKRGLGVFALGVSWVSHMTFPSMPFQRPRHAL